MAEQSANSKKGSTPPIVLEGVQGLSGWESWAEEIARLEGQVLATSPNCDWYVQDGMVWASPKARPQWSRNGYAVSYRDDTDPAA